MGYDDDLINVFDAISDANEFLEWAMKKGWTDDRILAVANIIQNTDAGIQSAAEYESRGKLIN